MPYQFFKDIKRNLLNCRDEVLIWSYKNDGCYDIKAIRNYLKLAPNITALKIHPENWTMDEILSLSSTLSNSFVKNIGLHGIAPNDDNPFMASDGWSLLQMKAFKAAIRCLHLSELNLAANDLSAWQKEIATVFIELVEENAEIYSVQGLQCNQMIEKRLSPILSARQFEQDTIEDPTGNTNAIALQAFPAP